MTAVVVDRWDGPELERAHEVAPFAAQRAALAERFGAWGGDALDDIFWLLFKVRPELTDVADVESSRIVGHVLVSLLARNGAVRRLRQDTMRDLVGSALAAAQLAPQFARALGGATPAGAEELTAGESDEPWIEDVLDRRRQAVTEQAQVEAEQVLDELETAVEAVADQVEAESRACAAWGLDGGKLQRLSVPERMELSKVFQNDRVQQITDLFGRLQMSMFAERAELDDVGVEPVNLEVGGNLERMVGAELLSMLCDDLFLARMGEGSLLQYAVHGEVDAGRGGIVLCVDGSGSMGMPHQGYTREMWATALKLHLLRVAIAENRPMHVLDFGTANELRYQRFVDPDERTATQLLEAAQHWWGWGTDFATPLKRAVQVLADENDRSSDVVFVSDGECQLSARSRETYQRAARVRGIRTWGVQLSNRAGGLRSFCDRIFTVTDLTSGRELGALLNAVQSPVSR